MGAFDMVPRTIFGGPLLGSKLMRFVFMDEAGTSPSRQEKIRVVAAVIAHADKQLTYAEVALDEALQAVPKQFQNGFLFHAEEIMNSDRYRDEWRLTDRIKFLCSVMSIPKKLGLTISFALISTEAKATDLSQAWKLKLHEEQHITAFLHCVSMADKWIRENADCNEIGMIIAENHGLKRHLGKIPAMLRERPIVAPSDEGIVWRDRDVAQGYCSQEAVFRVARIRKTVHFVTKDEDRLVWLADACAYGLKRFFSGAKWGDQFGEAIGATVAHMPDFARSLGSAGNITFRGAD